jgi:hypothetical protein
MDGFLFEKPGSLTATEERKRKGWNQRMRELRVCVRCPNWYRVDDEFC